MIRRNLRIQLGIYMVETDHSIWPIYEDITNETGYYIEAVTSSMVDKEVEIGYSLMERFANVDVYMSTKKMRYIRKRGKIGDAIAYVGGLVGLIIAFFAFCVSNYNKYSYELIVAEHTFNYDESGEKIRASHFGYFFYLKFQFFISVKSIFSKELNWPDCKKLEEVKKEAVMLLDIDTLFRKIRLIEITIGMLLSEE